MHTHTRTHMQKYTQRHALTHTHAHTQQQRTLPHQLCAHIYVNVLSC